MLKLETLFCITLATLHIGCVSLSNHTTGRTLGLNNNAHIASLNTGKINIKEYETFGDSANYGIVEVGVIYGKKESLNLGLRLSSALHLTAMSKLQIYGTKKSLLASSLALEIGTSPLATLLGINFHHTSIASVNSIYFNDYLTLTLSPKHIYFGSVNFGGQNRSEKAFTPNNIFGYSVGLQFGRKNTVSLELSQFTLTNSNSSFFQPHIGLAYIIK